MSLLLPTTASKNPSLFVTTFDPSDLPGLSIDPLGFERGNQLLADKILPGFTNVANNPRYLSMLCGGIYLAVVSSSDPPRVQYRKRLDAVLRLERFWGLANELAVRKFPASNPPSSGIRGISYVRKRLDSLSKENPTRLDADFPLLSRQVPYGVIGIYAAVADGMRLLDRKTLHLSRDLGEHLGKEFLESTKIPNVLRRAVIDDKSIGKKALTDWGERSHVSGDSYDGEKKYLHEAVHREPIRARMMQALDLVPRKNREQEQSWLKRVLPELKKAKQNLDLVESTCAILNYERCYQLVQFGFERILFLCNERPTKKLKDRELGRDTMLQKVGEQLPGAVSRFDRSCDSGTTDNFQRNLERLSNVRQFLQQASRASQSTVGLADEILQRHTDVQRGKFDRGRRKTPWVEKSNGGVSLIMRGHGGRDYKDQTSSQDIKHHPYRLGTAKALNDFLK